MIVLACCRIFLGWINCLLSSSPVKGREHRPAQGATFARCVNFGLMELETPIVLEHTVSLCQVPFTGADRQFQRIA
jgi:hypothetical protein